LKNHAILIVLLLFLTATAFFWFQVWRIKDLPPGKSVSPPVISAAEAEAFIKLAQELLIDYREPILSLYGRDPFVKEGSNDQLEIEKVEPSKKFVVSSIIYGSSNALAVINGRIMAEGDTIYDQEFGFFLIENIEDGRVEISDGEKKYTLQMVLVAGKSNRVGL
jgi:hypothetical protein